ncbi:MAG: response regulator [Alphaproteobacteria bacterium]
MDRNNILNIRRDFSKLSVLVVEDNQQMRILLTDMLRAFGFNRVLHTESGEDGTKYAATNHFDVVIANCRTIYRDQFSLAKFVRCAVTSINRQALIVMTTAHCTRELTLAARDHGINDIIMKPFSADILFSRLVWLIDHPRFFVRADSYVGPSRRRRQQSVIVERRKKNND